jgi:hypothetical protein
MLDLLRRGEAPEINRVLAGDCINETTGMRTRLSDTARAVLQAEATVALERMIDITEAAAEASQR